MRRSRPARAMLALLAAVALGLAAIALPASSLKAGGAQPWPEQPVSSEASTPRSGGVSSDAQLPSSTYTRTAALDIEDVVFGSDGGGLQRASKCPLDVSLVWSHTLNTGVYATGVLSHLYSDLDAGLQAVIPGFHRELNVLDHDGHHVPGSPIHMASEVYFHSSPLLIDFDRDGVKDIVWVNVDAEIFVINGDPQSEKTLLDYPWKIPKLKVKKNWYAHLETQDKPATTDAQATPSPSSQPAQPTQPSLNPQQPAAARRLMSANEAQPSPSSFESDPSHPLRIMRREKGRMYLVRRVRHKVRSMRTARLQQQQHQRQQQLQQAPTRTGRRLLQSKSSKSKPRSKSRRSRDRSSRSGRSRHSRDSSKSSKEAADGAAAATKDTKGASEEPKTPGAEEVWEEVEEVEEESGGEDEEEDETGVDEPVPAGGVALGIPDREAAAAGAVLESLAAKYAQTLDADDAYIASLQMPAGGGGGEDEGVVDDQEDDDDEEGGARMAGARSWDAEAEMQPQEVDEDAMSRAAAAALASAAAAAGARPASKPAGGASSVVFDDESDLSDFTAPQIRAALDELLEEDPDLSSSLSSLGLEGRDDGAGGTDYASAIKELADKYGRQQAEVEARQKARQQRTDREDQMAAARAAEADVANEPAPQPTGIASVDAAAAAANAARRRAAAAAALPDDINSNVVRIMGASKPASTKGGSGSGDLDALLAEQAALDSQLSMDGLPDEAQESLSLFSDDILPGSGSASSLRGLDPEVAWEMAELDRLYPVRAGDPHVWVDAHVLATPVLADLNGDGHPELVVSVSYFFDESDYANRPALAARLGPDVDLRKYVAGALVVLDLWTHKVLWTEHLDLSTDTTALRAYMYASPTVADLDGDGDTEIIVPTSMGFVYAFHQGNRQLLRGFPLVLSEIQAQVAVGDVNDDGLLEMVAQDSKGNVVCFTSSGSVLWSTLISGFSSQSATFGDVDGDGRMDVVVATVSGHVYALEGSTGKVLPHFPLRTDGRIIAPVTLVNLHEEASASDLLLAPRVSALRRRGLHLVFPSFDGHVYLVEGATGCVNKLDTGEHSYGQVLVADILGRGKLDLLVTTMSGNVYCFATEADSETHPLRSWTAQAQGLNGFTARDGYHGVYFTQACKRDMREVTGSEVTLEYVIVDERAKARIGAGAATATTTTAGAADGAGEASSDGSSPARPRPSPPQYEVSFHMGGSLIATTVHRAPGLYRHTLPAGRVPQYATIEVRMVNEHQQFFQDEFVAALNVHFYKIIKYLVLLPFLTMAVLMLVINKASYALPV